MPSTSRGLQLRHCRHDSRTGRGDRPPGSARGRRRDAIAGFTAKVLPGSSAHGRAPYEVEHLLFVRPDVVAVKVRQRYFTNDDVLESEGTPMYVVAREDGRWLLTANQNTAVLDG